MRNLISFTLPALLIIVFSLIPTHITFSQTDQAAASSNKDGKTSYVTGITSGRAKSLIGVVVGLSSIIIGWRVKRRSAAGPSGWRSWAITALALGLVALVLSVLHLANTNGGFGTGGGKAGAIVALILGLLGTSFSVMALRSKGK